MRILCRCLVAALALGSQLAAAKAPVLYSLAEQDTASAQATVRMQRSMNSGGLLLLTFDGKDPRSYPSMAAYAAQVQRAEAAMKPGQKFGLVNASPGRNEPQLIGVSPGPHTYGVMYMLIDVAFGGALNSRIGKSLAKRYLQENAEDNLTIKHYEALRFDSEAGKNYFVQYSWSDERSELSLKVQACTAKWKDCVDVPFESSNAQTKVLPGIGDQEL